MADAETQPKEETKGGSPKPDTDVAPPLITKRKPLYLTDVSSVYSE